MFKVSKIYIGEYIFQFFKYEKLRANSTKFEIAFREKNLLDCPFKGVYAASSSTF